MSSPAELKAQILRLTREYSALVHQANRPAGTAAEMLNDTCSVVGSGPNNPTTQQPTTLVRGSSAWQPGQTIPYAGRVFDQDEVEAAVSATLDFWLTLGPEGEAFEKELADLLGVKFSLLVNSGSSANLVAFAALTTHKLPPHKRIFPGDEVITVAAGFPTTVSPIIQLGAVAVFLDNNPTTGNLRPEQLESAYSPGKTKAVMIAHALGNPFDLAAVLEFCRRHDLWLIEDNCDALGCTYSLPVERAKALGLDHLLKLAEANAAKREAELTGLTVEGLKRPESETTQPPRPSTPQSSRTLQPKIPFIQNGILTAYTGTFGDISTQSFYPPHHLTMGEGGSVNIISRPPLKTYAESFRDWGRDCWCPSGKDDTCCKRFGWQLGELPKGYDHKYIYSHLGFNLKPLDPQAAIGRQQLKKLPAFIEARKQNWEILRTGLADLEDVFEFTLPTHAKRWIPPSERVPRDPAELLSDSCSLPKSGTNTQQLTTNNRRPAPTDQLLSSETNNHQPRVPRDPAELLSDSCSLPKSGTNTQQLTTNNRRPAPTDQLPKSETNNHQPTTNNQQLLSFAECFEWDSSSCRTDASWFGFMLRVKPSAPFSHTDLARALDEKKIGNRMLFGGNLLRQPVFVQIRKDRPEAIRLVGSNGSTLTQVNDSTISAAFRGADEIMHGALFLGTYPGLTPEMLAYEIETIHAFVRARRGGAVVK